MASTISSTFTFNFRNPLQQPRKMLQRDLMILGTSSKGGGRRRRRHFSLLTFPHHHNHNRLVLSRVSGDGSEAADATQQYFTPPETKSSKTSPTPGDGYVALFVRMLGLDNDPLDREQAIVALWKYSQGGKQCIDAIMQFQGCINLTVNLLNSDSSSTCEAAAGLLRTISSVHLYRDSVADCGGIEEINGLLSRSSLTAEVKEQSICILWNLSVDEKLRVKIANSDLLPTLIKFLEDEEIKVKEAAGGVLANLALSQSNHNIMVEAGVIPKLAKLLNTEAEGSKVTRKEAKNALLEFAKDEYYRLLIIEEGLVLVPLVGAAAYKSFRPASHSWPSLPDGTELERNASRPSRYGASELLLGLNIHDKNINLEDAKMNAIVGRTHQQFLARIGAIELEDERNPQSVPLTNQGYTLLPCIDGVARLVLILELEDPSAISRAAKSISDASINEHMRISFKEAGAVKHLVRLLGHNSEAVRLSATHALERLSVSNYVCRILESEGVLYPLVNALKQREMSESLLEKTMDILARILDPGKEMKLKFYDGPVNGSEKALSTTRSQNGTTGLAGNQEDRQESKLTTENLLDSGVISCFIEILKTSSPHLQRKAASILEYVAVIESCTDTIIAKGIVSALDAVFQQKIFDGIDDDIDVQLPDLTPLEAEEAGLLISAASRLLTKLLDSEQFRNAINYNHSTQVLRKILKSDIPVHHKDWVAASLVKLQSFSNSQVDLENPIKMEVIIYETIPRLIEELKTSFSPEEQEASVIELNSIISKGVVDCTRTVAAEGGIFPLVKVIEEGTVKAIEASLAILYNLSMNSENHSAIIAAGAVPVLRRIVLSQGPQWMRALHLLRTLPTR